MKKSSLLLFLLSMLIGSTLHADIHLTKDEQAWLSRHEIKLLVAVGFEPIVIQQQDKLTGILPDYINELSQIINKKIELVPYESGRMSIPEALENYDVIGSTTVLNNQMFNDKLVYTNPYMFSPLVFFSNKKMKNQIKNKQDLVGKRIAVVKKNKAMVEKIKKIPNVDIVLANSVREQLEMLHYEKVDVVVGYSNYHYLINKNLLSNIYPVFTTEEILNIYFGIKKEAYLLKDILNKALNSLGEVRKQEIISQWLEVKQKQKISMKEAEWEYLKEKKKLILCTHPNRMPFEKIEEGKHVGLMAEYLKLLEEYVGVPLLMLPTSSMEQSHAYLKNKTCDLISLVSPSLEKSHYMNYTSLFLETPLVLVTRLDNRSSHDLLELNHQKIGIPKGDIDLDYFRETYPNLEFIALDDLSIGYKKVEDKELYGVIGELYTQGYHVQKEYLGILKIAGKLDKTLSYGIGVRKDEQLLVDVLNGAIKKYPFNDQRHIVDQWLTLKLESKFDLTYVWMILGFFFVVVLFIVSRQYALKKINAKLEKRVKEEIEMSRKKDNLIYYQNKMASLGEMVTNIGHQWKQPLSELAMSGNITIAKIDNDLMELREVRERVQKEQEIIKFMSYTIDNFINFYKRRGEDAPFFIHLAYANSQYILNETLNLNNTKLVEAIEPDLQVYGNINLLEQVFLAIMQNSLYFFKARGIKEPFIKISAIEKEDKVLIEIEDNAGGIKTEYLHQIFDYNFSYRDGNEASTGIGMHLSKLIITDKFNGDLKVENTEDGAKFTIILQSYNQK